MAFPKFQMTEKTAFSRRFSIEKQAHAAAIVVQRAFVARKTSVFSSETRHLVFGNHAQFAVEIDAVLLFVDIALDGHRPTIVPFFIACADAKRQIIDNSSHPRVDVAVFVVGTKQHFSPQNPSTQLRGIAAFEAIALALRVAA